MYDYFKLISDLSFPNFGVEFGTLLLFLTQVAKVSQGQFPPPFLISCVLNDLFLCANIKTSFLIKQILLIFFEKFYEKRSGKKLVGSSPKTVELKFYIFVIT